MWIIETLLKDREDILVGMLFTGNFSDVLNGFKQIGRNRNPRAAIAADAAHVDIEREREAEGGGERKYGSEPGLEHREDFIYTSSISLSPYFYTLTSLLKLLLFCIVE